jgi:hypothetical protein
MPYEQISVECYSGYKADERPVAFTFQGQRREIAEIIDRWYEGGLETECPAANYFKVKTTEGNVFLLRYLSHFDAWSIRTQRKHPGEDLIDT